MDVFEPGSELLKRQVQETFFLLEPYIPRHSISVLFGKPTLGKTAIAWQFANAVQTGQPLWGHPTAQANVLFMELDMPMDLTQLRWQDSDPVFQPGFVTVFDNVSIDCMQFLANYPDQRHKEIKHLLTTLHEKYQFGLVCVDALREVVVGELNSSGLPRRVYDAFFTMFPGASVLFVHHEKKAQAGFNPDSLQLASGNMEFMNVAQIAMQFHKVRGQTYLSHLKTQASIKFDPLPLTISQDGVHFVSLHDERNAKVLAAIQAAPAGLSKRDLDRLVGEQLGVGERTIRVVRKALMQLGQLK